MGPEVPLLNDYKQEFFWKRFPQTLLGGPRLKLGYCAPPYVYLHQLLLFLTPCMLGGVGTVLYQVGVLGDAYAATLSGGLMLAVAATLQTLAQCVARRTGVVQRLSAQNNILADEEEVEFSHCVAPETVRFIVPGKKFMVNVVLHTLLAGMLCGLGTWYLLPGSLIGLYGGMGAAMPVFALSWVTLCSGEYALIVNTPPETATFQPQDTYEITALTRPLYILIFIAVDLVYRLTDPMNELRLACQVLHVVFVVLPVLWALGTLPPPDALLLWAMEQVLVLGLGGSAMATNLRLLVMFLVSASVAVSTYFIPSTLGIVLFTVGMGYLLSLDGSQLGAVFRSRRAQSRALSLGLKGLPLGLIFLAGAMADGGLLHHYLFEHPTQTGNLSLEGPPTEELPSVSLHGVQAAVAYALICLLVLSKGLREIQGVFLLGGTLRNPLYPKQTGCSQAFRRSSRGLRLAGYLRRVLLNLVSPFAMITFLALDGSLLDLHTASLAVGFTRAFRMVWQSSEDALLQMVVVVLIRLGSEGAPATGWHSLGTGVQLLVVGLLIDRASQFISKLKFALTVIVTSWTETKQRRQSTSAMLMLNAVLFPLLLGELVLSALLSAPLLPLFTLPIFLVGFPRPLRSWPGTPGTACPCPDSVYYQQLSARLASALRGAIACGALGAAPPGSHFLCRFQDRVMWLTLLERGYGYCTLNIKGLELQETSCHTLEARRMDEVFEAALAQSHAPNQWRQLLNPHWGNTLTPCCALPVRLYSDARNVLTGIIDSHEHLRKLRADYVKVLLWLLLQRCAQRDRLTPPLQEKAPLSPGADSGSSQRALQRDTQFSTTHLPGSHSSSFSSSSSMSTSSSPGQRGSLSSSADWLDDDDLFGPQVARRPVPAPRERNFSLPGSVEVLSLYENMALSALPPLRPLGLGLPAADRGSSDGGGGGLHEASFLPAAGPRRLSGPHAQLLPSEWRTAAPLAPPQMLQLQPLVPADWFHFAVGRLAAGGQHAAALLQEERDALELFSQVALSCLVALGLEAEQPSPSLVFRLYGGGAPWSEALDWLKGRRELHQLALKAFRYSFKLLFDQASLGAMESAEELQATLDEYEHHWYIGTATDHGWQESVRQEKPFLFSLGHDLAMGTYTGRVLTLQEQLVYVGHVCAEGVRGQWANLSWELLYATNDDEERYSIQAHPVLLRNLTVQAADPPLGYPIYSSAPLHLGCL
ncbi:hypothetical protein AALO_G00246010 [Alosa alosa]|uniref:Pecanex-like protein n=1 Tax=Alosa alosa TaxID=278164 RepID=A0AAV6FSB7_9TELE|nr:pecanex-like protein 4 [Alosa alosa]XP_048084135.1 pecanex-like protein 4 [Alosa alosa]KAG5265753.1 hypothetical protein AALO_G00246010 [Alosa alosa]